MERLTPGPTPTLRQPAWKQRLAAFCAAPQSHDDAWRAPVQDGIANEATQGEAGLHALVEGLCAMHEALHEAGSNEASHEALSCALAPLERQAIDALACLAQAHPDALSAAYAQAQHRGVQDALCEAAGQSGSRHPALHALQVAHLPRNAFVASLSLAQQGGADAQQAILAQLQAQLATLEAMRKQPGPADDGLAVLHIEGMLEALDHWPTPVPAALTQRVVDLVPPVRGRWQAIAAWLARREHGAMAPSPRD